MGMWRGIAALAIFAFGIYIAFQTPAPRTLVLPTVTPTATATHTPTPTPISTTTAHPGLTDTPAYTETIDIKSTSISTPVVVLKSPGKTQAPVTPLPQMPWHRLPAATQAIAPIR